MSKASVTRQVVWVSLTALLLQQGAQLWLSNAPAVVWVLLLPLAIFIPGIIRDNLRSYIWLCFVCLLYFMRLVVAVFATEGGALAITGTVAVVILFISAMMYVRWRARELREAAILASGHGG